MCFASRLGRVADQADALPKTDKSPARDDRLRLLRVRSRALDFAVALAGAFTCSAVLVLFLGELHGAANLLYLFFGGGIVLTRAPCSPSSSKCLWSPLAFATPSIEASIHSPPNSADASARRDDCGR
jgi:hypothetical protein